MELLHKSGGCHDDGNLHRFMVTGNITGGHLKPPAEADKESIQVFQARNQVLKKENSSCQSCKGGVQKIKMEI